jgi:hypothetical protein
MSCRSLGRQTVKPIGTIKKHTDDGKLRVRYAELLRLREYVQQLESAQRETTEPWSTVKRYEFESGRRFSQSFTTDGD